MGYFRDEIMTEYGKSCKVPKAQSTNVNYGLRVPTPLPCVYACIRSTDLSQHSLILEVPYSQVTGVLIDEVQTLAGEKLSQLPYFTQDENKNRRCIPSPYDWRDSYENGGICKNKQSERSSIRKCYHDSWSCAFVLAKSMLQNNDLQQVNIFYSPRFFDDAQHKYFDYQGVHKYLYEYCDLSDATAIKNGVNAVILTCHHLKFFLICNSEYFDNGAKYDSSNKFSISMKGRNDLAQLRGGYNIRDFSNNKYVQEVLNLCGVKLSVIISVFVLILYVNLIIFF